MREIWSNKALLDSIKEIRPSEEDKYSDIPGWEGHYLAESPDAVLLYIVRDKRADSDVWFPKSQLRIAEDRQSLYASTWILDQKGLG